MVVIWRLSPLCKVVSIPESRKFLPGCEIRNPGLWNPVAYVYIPPPPVPHSDFSWGEGGSVHRLKFGITPTIKIGRPSYWRYIPKGLIPRGRTRGRAETNRVSFAQNTKKPPLESRKSPQCIGLNRVVNSFWRCDQANTASFTHTFAFKKLTLAQTESPK